MSFVPDDVDPRSLDVVELVKLCGISGAARVLGLPPHVVQSGYELETGDSLPRTADIDTEVVSACAKILAWAEAAGRSHSDFVVTIGAALRLTPAQAESLYRRLNAPSIDKTLDRLERMVRRTER